MPFPQCEGNEEDGAMTVRNLFHEKPRTAFVLGGGGNLGAIQVGQLRALLERDIVPDAVVGCSVGALNGAAIAGNPTLDEANRIATVWKALSRSDIFSSTRRSHGPLAFIRNGVSAYTDQGLRKLIQQMLSFDSFDEATARFSVVATSLRSGIEHWFEKGELLGPLLASTALPGAFPPVDIDGELYIDGGVVNNVPISKAFEMKAKTVYVLDVGNLEKEARTPKRPYEVLMHAVTIARAHRFRTERDQVPDGVQMVRMPAIDVGKLRYDDFSRSAELIERSYKVSAAFLDKNVIAQTA
jgi:NTE family protein